MNINLDMGRSAGRLARGAAVCLVALAVAACGGGNSSSAADGSATAQQEGATATAQAIGATSDAPTVRAQAVPPGWVGRMPPAETINGIAVPPEPSPILNNATLAGVDVNKNGVRDDVERVIAKKAPNSTSFSASMEIAAATQSILTAGLQSQAEADKYTLAVACASEKMVDVLTTKDVQLSVVNNPARLNSFKSATRKYGGIVVDASADCK